MGFRLSGLDPATSYYVRLVAEDEPEPGVKKTAAEQVSFATSGPPTATTFAVHALHGESLRLLGSVTSGSVLLNNEQTVTVAGATGGTFSLSFDGQSTGATGSGNIVGGAASGSGDLSAATGRAVYTIGSTTITGVKTTSGAFSVGQTISAPVLQDGTTIVTVGTNTLTLSKPAVCGPGDCEGASGSFEETFDAGSTKIANVVTSAGVFTVGQGITGVGIDAGSVVTAVETGAITISQPASDQGSGVVLTGNTKIVSDVAVSSGVFVIGEAVSGPGIPAGTTIVGENSTAHTLELSADTTESRVGEALTASLPYNAEGETIRRALSAIPSNPEVFVEGVAGGPYTLYFYGKDGGVKESQVTANASSLTPMGSTVTVATTNEGGEPSYDLHYYFEYVDAERFAESEWREAASTPAVAGSGEVGVDVPGLTAGETYHYRLVAASTFPGSAVVRGAGETLTVPVPMTVEKLACSNEQFRTGPSANLPACRAYEQVTPVDKEGSQEIFEYNASGDEATAIAGEDGEHFVVEDKGLNWGSGAGEGQSPYFFSRTGGGWQMTAAATQPETGVSEVIEPIFSSDLTDFGFLSRVDTSANAEAKEVQLRTGPPGGPYVAVATFPNKTADEVFVGASQNFSRLFLQSEDRTLSGSSTHTISGEDLYEYAGGQLRQVNVNSEGKKLGSCGATIPGAVKKR